MRIVSLLLAVLLSFLLLSSCGAGGAHPDLSGALSFQARFDFASQSVSVSGRLGPRTGAGARDAELTVLSPASLAGVTFARRDGLLSASRDGVCVSLRYDDFFAFLSVFELSLPPAGSERTEEGQIRRYTDGVQTLVVTVPDGSRIPSALSLSSPAGTVSVRILP